MRTEVSRGLSRGRHWSVEGTYRVRLAIHVANGDHLHSVVAKKRAHIAGTLISGAIIPTLIRSLAATFPSALRAEAGIR